MNTEQGGTDRTLSEYELVALEVGEIVARKNKAYGDAVAKSGNILRILYPEGVRPEQYSDALAITRVIDKLCRIATDNDAFGEDPWSDILGYAILRTLQRKKENPHYKGEEK